MTSACRPNPATLRIGEYIRHAREAAGISQYVLAERLGCKQPAISRLEAGGVSPNMATLQRIADALELELEVQMVPIDKALSTGQPFKFRSRTRRDHG